jgi:hypothetical protein
VRSTSFCTTDLNPYLPNGLAIMGGDRTPDRMIDSDNSNLPMVTIKHEVKIPRALPRSCLEADLPRRLVS